MFGSRLRAAMKSSGMRAPDLAKLCGVRRQTVAKWLLMREADLAAKHADCIALAMRTDLHTLIAGENSK